MQTVRNMTQRTQLLQLMLLLATLFFSVQSFATAKPTIPEHVFDFAKFYDNETLNQYNVILQAIEDERALKIEAVLLPSLGNNSADAVSQYFYQQMNKRSGTIQDNVLLLVSDKEGIVLILPSPSLRPIYNDSILLEISNKVKEHLKAKEHREILKTGLGGIIHYYDAKTSTVTKKDSIDIEKLVRNSLLLLALGLFIFFVMRYGKKKPKQVG